MIDKTDAPDDKPGKDGIRPLPNVSAYESNDQAQTKGQGPLGRQKAPVKTSRTGAVLGKPGAEHSQYGLTDATTPEQEQAIRGVAPQK